MKYLISLIFLLPVGAGAEPTQGRGHTVAVSVSPVHFIFPMVEVTVEAMLTPAFSVALIGGAGLISGEDSSGDEVSFAAYELGAQVRGYLYGGSEEGAFVGAEVLYAQVSSDDIGDGAKGVGVGTELAAIGGYKWTWDHFFIDLNGGVGYLIVSAEADDGEDTQEANDSEIVPVLNFNLGWSF